MISMTLNKYYIFWHNKFQFRKRHPHMKAECSRKPKRALIKILCKSLSFKTSSKAIVCGNVVKSLGMLQDDARIWMIEPSSFVHGTTSLVFGGEYIILKKHQTVQFTRHFERSDIVDVNSLTPRVLIGASVCISTGVDCVNVTLVASVEMSTSLIHSIQ